MIKKLIPYYFFLFATIFSLDRITKFFALDLVVPVRITSFLHFELSFNRGISWGMLYSDKRSVFVLVSLSIALVIGIVAWYAYEQLKAHHMIIGETMVLAGAVSNLLDRCIYHGVIDFIVIHAGDWYWPSFNVADIAVVVGVGIMLCSIIRQK